MKEEIFSIVLTSSAAHLFALELVLSKYIVKNQRVFDLYLWILTAAY